MKTKNAMSTQELRSVRDSIVSRLKSKNRQFVTNDPSFDGRNPFEVAEELALYAVCQEINSRIPTKVKYAIETKGVAQDYETLYPYNDRQAALMDKARRLSFSLLRRMKEFLSCGWQITTLNTLAIEGADILLRA
jgi:hypothetical protein